jgi:hypothetical protein
VATACVLNISTIHADISSQTLLPVEENGVILLRDKFAFEDSLASGSILLEYLLVCL